MKISEEVRAQIDQDELDNAKYYAKMRVERQIAIRKNIENLEDEFKSIQEELDRIDNNDFSKVPKYHGGTLPINMGATTSSSFNSSGLNNGSSTFTLDNRTKF